MSKPLFTTKHYKALAEIVRPLNNEARRRTYTLNLRDLREMLEKDNPKFDKKKFYALVK